MALLAKRGTATSVVKTMLPVLKSVGSAKLNSPNQRPLFFDVDCNCFYHSAGFFLDEDCKNHTFWLD